MATRIGDEDTSENNRTFLFLMILFSVINSFLVWGSICMLGLFFVTLITADDYSTSDFYKDLAIYAIPSIVLICGTVISWVVYKTRKVIAVLSLGFLSIMFTIIEFFVLSYGFFR